MFENHGLCQFPLSSMTLSRQCFWVALIILLAPILSLTFDLYPIIKEQYLGLILGININSIINFKTSEFFLISTERVPLQTTFAVFFVGELSLSGF